MNIQSTNLVNPPLNRSDEPIKDPSLIARIRKLVAVTIPSLSVFFYYIFVANCVFQKNKVGILAERALSKGNSKLLFALKHLGADFNTVNCIDKSSNSMTVWECALASDDPMKMIDDLLACGADINKQNKFGTAPLHRAIEQALFFQEPSEINARIEIIEKLINKQANLDVQDNLGNTPAHLAAMKKNRDNENTFHRIWDILQLQNADFTIINNEEKTAEELLNIPNTGTQKNRGDWIDALMSSKPLN